jgi:hypothetical protein
VFNHQPAMIDEFLADGKILPFWSELQVVDLPGNTTDHWGFFSNKLNLPFRGDMFTGYFFNVHKPWPILNNLLRAWKNPQAPIASHRALSLRRAGWRIAP